MDQARRSRTEQLSQLTRLYNELDRLMISAENAEKVQQLYDSLSGRFEKFKSAHLECVDTCYDSFLIDTLKENYESCNKNYEEFRDRFSHWIKQVKTTDKDANSTVSVINSASSANSQKRLRCAKAKRLIAECKMKKLREKLELERARKELEIKEQLIEQQSEIEEAALEESVWQQAVHEDTGKTLESVSASGTVRDPGSINSTSAEDRVTCNGLTGGRGADVSMLIPPGSNMASCVRQSSTSSDGTTLDSARAPQRMTTTEGGCGDGRETSGSASDRRTSQTRVTTCSETCTDRGKYKLVRPVDSDMCVNNIDVAFQRLASTLHEGFELPKPELLTFNGSPTD